jgi:hypothetical protein
MDRMVFKGGYWLAITVVGVIAVGTVSGGGRGRVQAQGEQRTHNPAAACRLSPGRAVTIADLWRETLPTPAPVHLAGVHVTAVSDGACVDGRPCELAVQQRPGYASLAEGWRQALEVSIDAGAAAWFKVVRVGDRIDIDGHAEHRSASVPVVRVEVDAADCMAIRGHGEVTPVGVRAAELSVAAYLGGVGPLLVETGRVTGVVGRPDESFRLRDPAAPEADSLRLSPSRMPAGAFVDMAAGRTTELLAVAGTLGEGTTGAPEIELRPRGAADLWVFASWQAE